MIESERAALVGLRHGAALVRRGTGWFLHSEGRDGDQYVRVRTRVAERLISPHAEPGLHRTDDRTTIAGQRWELPPRLSHADEQGCRILSTDGQLHGAYPAAQSWLAREYAQTCSAQEPGTTIWLFEDGCVTHVYRREPA